MHVYVWIHFHGLRNYSVRLCKYSLFGEDIFPLQVLIMVITAISVKVSPLINSHSCQNELAVLDVVVRHKSCI